jgi:hypothetical protein
LKDSIGVDLMLKKILSRVTNTNSSIALISLLMIILNNFNEINSEWFLYVTDSVATILITIGILNKKGMETTKWDK